MGKLTEIHNQGNPDSAQPVRTIDGYKDRVSKAKALVATTSTSLNTILDTESITSDDIGAVIISDGTVRYNPAGAAGATNGLIPTVYIVHGGKAFLETVRLYSAGTPEVSVILFSQPGA